MKIRPSDLRPRDVIVEETARTRITVQTIDECPNYRRGVGRTHVNEKHCYDNAALIEIIRQ